MDKLTLIFVSIFSIGYGLPSSTNQQGLANLEIIGGNATDILHHPWQIGIFFSFDNSFLCGGSIISDTWIITAAHCTEVWDNDDINIKLGSTFVTGGETYNIKKIVVHPEYNSTKSHDHDISLLKVTKAIKTPDASAIGLPSQDEELEVGTNVTVTGWGSISKEGPSSETLLETSIPTVSTENCIKEYVPLDLSVTENMLCAGIEGRGPCYGDSGGPLARNRTLYGIVSWGNACDTTYSAVFTKVSKYVKWIKDITGH